MEAWVKPSRTGAESTIFAKASSPVLAPYILSMSAADQTVLRLHNSSGATFVNLNSSATLGTGAWSHVSAACIAFVVKFVVSVFDKARE